VPPTWIKGSRWEQERLQIQAAYQRAQWGITSRLGATYEAWTLRINPTPVPAELSLVLSDLAAGRMVGIGRNGRIAHLEQCPAPHDNEDSVRITLPQKWFTIELEYPEYENGAAGPAHPRVRILLPEISTRTFPQHPHLFSTHDRRDSWACAVAPHDRDWNWVVGGTVQYLDQVAIWLLKTIFWVRTGGGILQFGRWLGPDAPHDLASLIAIRGEAPCRCGNGQPYAACHQATDQIFQPA